MIPSDHNVPTNDTKYYEKAVAFLESNLQYSVLQANEAVAEPHFRGLVQGQLKINLKIRHCALLGTYS